MGPKGSGPRDCVRGTYRRKAFDRVDDFFLFAALQAFGVWENFSSWVKVLVQWCMLCCEGGGRVEQSCTS